MLALASTVSPPAIPSMVALRCKQRVQGAADVDVERRIKCGKKLIQAFESYCSKLRMVVSGDIVVVESGSCSC
jgi:hypothetical protein